MWKCVFLFFKKDTASFKLKSFNGRAMDLKVLLIVQCTPTTTTCMLDMFTDPSRKPCAVCQ